MRLDELPEYREVVERARIDTDISDHLTTLFAKALEVKPRLIVELGVRDGESTFVLERVARLSSATLVSVDLEDCAKASTWDRWHFVKSDDVEFAHRFTQWCLERGLQPEIDVLFVDTSHELDHTRREVRSWLPFLAPGGRAFFHDTNLRRVVRRKNGRKQHAWDNARGVTRALEEFLGRSLDERRDFAIAHGDWRIEHRSFCHGFTTLERIAPAGDKAKVAVFCERIDNESFCESIVRELSAHYDVRAYGPGWPKAELTELDREGLHFHLELDPASGNFHRPPQLDLVTAPKVAWLIDTHKKPDFHRAISRDMDLTFFAMRNWGHVLEGRTAWLPLHCDQKIFYPQERERDLDVVFVGSYGWRAEPVLRIAKKHGLRVHVECTTGEREKTKTAELYARAKLVFNRHVTNDLNFRVFEAAACGRVLLTDAQPNGQYDLFVDGKHVVYYKDEQDLERLMLELLGDRAKRAQIERDAATTSRAEHTTRARVKQLRDAVETFLGDQRRSQGCAVERAVVEGTSRSREKKRWLVVTSGPYGERVANSLRERGHDVLVASEKRSVLPAREVEGRVALEAVSLAPTFTELDRALASASPLHRRLTKVLEKRGPFDAVLAEGAWSALVAAPAAERLGLPFFLALERVEIERRRNKLTREQLNVAEVEHWAVERARAVLAPNPGIARDIERYYDASPVLCLPGAKRDTGAPRGGSALAAALGLGTFGVVLGSSLSPAEKRIVLTSTENTIVLVSDDLRAGRRGEESRVLSSGAPCGSVLAALAGAANLVMTLDPKDERVPFVAPFARVLTVVPRERILAGGEWAKFAGPLETPEPNTSRDALPELEALVEPQHALL